MSIILGFFANALKQQAKSHEVFRSLCINVAQLSHRTEMNWKMKVLGYKKEVIRPLSEARAIDAGANFLGELFIFGVAASLILAEQVRSRSQAKKQRTAVDDRLDDLEKEMAERKEEIERLRTERDLLRDEVDVLANEADTLTAVVMQMLNADMKRRSIDWGHPPPSISAEMIQKFENGENIDSSLRESMNESKDPK
ncbi:hypothetical protein LPJ56_002007 [Coemansia sp. RSA 2599]|nr:hypothetical protein LPJ56_002007 [Coemansia sp. RSA 2599]